MSTEKNCFQCKGYSKRILEKLHDHLFSQALCDVVLIAGIDGTKVSAHRLVLSASSEYFCAMFRAPMRESDEKVITVQDVSGSVLQSIVYYCYSGHIDLHEDYVETVLGTASLMQLDPLVTACADFLVSDLHPSNCIGIAQFLQQHNCTDDYKKAEAFIHQNYVEVCKSDEFLELNVEQLCELIASDDLVVYSEVDVFNSCMSWLNHDRPNREVYSPRLVVLLRLPLLPPEFITEHVKPLCTSNESKDMINEALEWFYQAERRSQLSLLNTRPRQPAEILISIGRCRKDNYTFLSYNQSLDKWFDSNVNIPEILFNDLAMLGDSLLFVADTQLVGFNFETMTLAGLNRMNTSRTSTRCGVLDGCLYVLGGFVIGTGRSNLVERWDPKVSNWSYMTPMNVKRESFGAAVLNELLYAVGGGGDEEDRSVEVYDRHTNKWTSRAPMNHPRYSFGITAGNGFLYVVGGVEDGESCGLSSPIDTVERYDPVADTWTILCSISNAQYNIGCAILGNILLAVGGTNYELKKNNFQEFDIATNKWTQKNTLLNVTSRVVKIPIKYALPSIE